MEFPSFPVGHVGRMAADGVDGDSGNLVSGAASCQHTAGRGIARRVKVEN